jgi:hypothetical protein
MKFQSLNVGKVLLRNHIYERSQSEDSVSIHSFERLLLRLRWNISPKSSGYQSSKHFVNWCLYRPVINSNNKGCSRHSRFTWYGRYREDGWFTWYGRLTWYGRYREYGWFTPCGRFTWYGRYREYGRFTVVHQIAGHPKIWHSKDLAVTQNRNVNRTWLK